MELKHEKNPTVTCDDPSGHEWRYQMLQVIVFFGVFNLVCEYVVSVASSTYKAITKKDLYVTGSS